MKFLVDENLPRSVAPRLSALGHNVLDLRQVNKTGLTDIDIMKLAQKDDRIIITMNYKHFGNLLMFPPEKSPGIVVIRMPNLSISTVITRVIIFLSNIDEKRLSHSLTILEYNRARRRVTK